MPRVRWSLSLILVRTCWHQEFYESRSKVNFPRKCMTHSFGKTGSHFQLSKSPFLIAKQITFDKGCFVLSYMFQRHLDDFAHVFPFAEKHMTLFLVSSVLGFL